MNFTPKSTIILGLIVVAVTLVIHLSTTIPVLDQVHSSLDAVLAYFA